MTNVRPEVSQQDEENRASRSIRDDGTFKNEVQSLPRKASYIGAPKVFALELACQHVSQAFGGFGCYVVGSALDRPDWRDVDVRCILSDEEFATLFPDASPTAWEFDPRWLVMTVSISAWLSQQSGLPVDFQFQPQTHANARHPGKRNAIGMLVRKEPTDE